MAQPVSATDFLGGLSTIGGHTSHAAPQVNLENPGSFGYMFDPKYLNAMIPHLDRNAIIEVIYTPGWMDHIPGGERLKKSLKSACESHAQTWDGLTRTLTPEFAGITVDGNNQQLEVYTRVTRAPVAPSMTLPERKGRPWQLLLEEWANNAGPHADSQVIGIATRGDLISELPLVMGPSFTGMTIIAYEPSDCFRYIDRSMIVTNMMPKGCGDNVLKRDKTAAPSTREISVEWTGISFVGKAIDELAYQYMQRQQVRNTYPDLRASIYTGSTQDLTNSAGYRSTVEAARARA